MVARLLASMAARAISAQLLQLPHALAPLPAGSAVVQRHDGTSGLSGCLCCVGDSSKTIEHARQATT